jgi:hypothetical protein
MYVKASQQDYVKDDILYSPDMRTGLMYAIGIAQAVLYCMMKGVVK